MGAGGRPRGYKMSEESKQKTAESVKRKHAVKSANRVKLVMPEPLANRVKLVMPEPLANTELTAYEQEMPTWLHEVIRLRAENVPFPKIAQQLKLPQTVVQDAWATKMNELRLLDPKIVDAYRVEDLERIERMIAELEAELKRVPGNPFLMKSIGEWHDRKVKLLGTIAPERREVAVAVVSYADRLKALDSTPISDELRKQIIEGEFEDVEEDE